VSSKRRQKPLGFVVIPYVEVVLEDLKKNSSQYNIKTIFSTKHTLRNSLMRTRPEIKLLQAANCIYNIPCECSRSYMGKTGRHYGYRSKNRGSTVERVLERNPNWSSMLMKKVTGYTGKMWKFYKLKLTTDTENLRNLP
jgi:hypothetical protein